MYIWLSSTKWLASYVQSIHILVCSCAFIENAGRTSLGIHLESTMNDIYSFQKAFINKKNQERKETLRIKDLIAIHVQQ